MPGRASFCAELGSGVFLDLADQPLVLFMRSNPEPKNTLARINSEGTKVRTDSHGPVFANTLEMKRWMLRVRFQQLIIVSCELLKFR